MITTKNYKTLSDLKNANPEAYNALLETSNDHLSSLGFASHEIKNMISFMNSSYQFISMKHPETADFKFWKEFGDNINHLIYFMDRTSVYRYCMKVNLTPTNIIDMLYSLPDEADERHPDSLRNFKFNMQTEVTRSAHTLADAEHLLIALNELIDNCYDATKDNDTITIGASVTVNSHTYESNPDVAVSQLHITISNPGRFPDVEYSELCKPFYTTKAKRSGLGLSIAHTVITNHNGEMALSTDDAESTVHIYLPLCNS